MNIKVTLSGIEYNLELAVTTVNTPDNIEGMEYSIESAAFAHIKGDGGAAAKAHIKSLTSIEGNYSDEEHEIIKGAIASKLKQIHG